MKKKVLSILLVGAMVASMGAIAGCSSSSDSSDDTTATSTAEEEETTDDSSDSSSSSDDSHTLTIMAWDESFNIPALEAAAEDYRENVDPDFVLDISVQSGSSDIETLLTNVGADTSGKSLSELPDLVLFQDHYIQQYVADYPDLFVALSDDIDINWDDFSEEKIDYSTIDGTHYGVPVDAGTVVFAYRTDYLEAAGYTIDDLTGITWAEFLDIGEDVYNATGKYLLCINADGNDLFYMMLQAEGVSQFQDGEPYITENETLVEIMEVLVEAYERNVLYLANSWEDYTNQAIQGDMLAGVMNGNWILPTIEGLEDSAGLWDITTMPTLTGAEGYASNGGSSLYITANCSNTELAESFLAYTFGGSTDTYDAALTDGGVISTYSPALETETYQAGVEFFSGEAIYAEICSWTQNVAVVEQSDYHYTAREYLGNALVNICQSGYTVEAALEEAESNLRFAMGLD